MLRCIVYCNIFDLGAASPVKEGATQIHRTPLAQGRILCSLSHQGGRKQKNPSPRRVRAETNHYVTPQGHGQKCVIVAHLNFDIVAELIQRMPAVITESCIPIFYYSYSCIG